MVLCSLLVFMKKIISILRKCTKVVAIRAALFGLETKSIGSVAVFRGPTFKGGKRGEEEKGRLSR